MKKFPVRRRVIQSVFFRRGPHGRVSSVVSPRATDHGQGGRRKQLRAGTLLDRPRGARTGHGASEEAGRPVHRPAGQQETPKPQDVVCRGHVVRRCCFRVSSCFIRLEEGRVQALRRF